MSKYFFNPEKHNRRSIRLKGYDYSQKGLYFITLCTKNKKHLFGEIINGANHLNQFGEIVREEWLKTTKIRSNISLGEFIIMPNHLHGIIKIDYQTPQQCNSIGEFRSPSNTIGAIIRGFKGATTKRINQIRRDEFEERSSTGELLFAPNGRLFPNGSIWQRNYYENIIRNEQALINISRYIINNPKKWDKDRLK